MICGIFGKNGLFGCVWDAKKASSFFSSFGYVSVFIRSFPASSPKRSSLEKVAKHKQTLRTSATEIDVWT